MVEIDGDTELTGILGHDISYTLSPAMHNAAFRHYGLNWAYLPLRVAPEGLGAAVEGLRALGFRGFNVTIPHKLMMAELVDRLEGDAEMLGAVNTVVVDNGMLVGHNTDVEGFRAFLRELGVGIGGSKVMVIGAGGAARAVALAAAREGATEVLVVNRTPERAAELAEALKKAIPSTEISVRGFDREGMHGAGGCSLVVNCTPLAEMGDLPLDRGDLAPGTWAVDLKYGEPTGFLREAKSRGALTAGGEGMLLHQAGLSFRMWTGKEPPLEEMRSALQRAISKTT